LVSRQKCVAGTGPTVAAEILAVDLVALVPKFVDALRRVARQTLDADLVAGHFPVFL
jgi:hypothetical protein